MNGWLVCEAGCVRKGRRGRSRRSRRPRWLWSEEDRREDEGYSCDYGSDRHWQDKKDNWNAAKDTGKERRVVALFPVTAPESDNGGACGVVRQPKPGRNGGSHFLNSAATAAGTTTSHFLGS